MPEPAIKKAAVMGWPARHSLSPTLHNYWLKRYGIAGEYSALETAPEAFETTFRQLHEQGFCGVNLTAPYKEEALRLLDDVDAVARTIGAVNTVVIDAQGRYRGTNTDAFGFIENLRRYGPGWDAVPRRKAAVLGAGGAARAVCAALTEEGFARITVANRNRARSKELVRDFGVEAVEWGDRHAALADADILINATTLGMSGQPPLEIALDRLPRAAWVNDIVYMPRHTPLLQQARDRGHVTIGGIGMLICQAQPAFAAWFGQMPDITPDLERLVGAA